MADRGKQQQRIRKSYRNFILSRISQLQKDEAFVDVRLTNGQGEIVNAHKIVLAGLSALLKEALASTTLNYEEDLEPNVTIIIPDFDMKTLEYFVLLRNEQACRKVKSKREDLSGKREKADPE